MKNEENVEDNDAGDAEETNAARPKEKEKKEPWHCPFLF